MSPTEHSQLYSDVTHCLDVLVDTIADEVLEGVNDLVLDGKIALARFFERHGMVDDGCDRHVFFSSYQRDIIKRVEKKVSRKGYVCRVKVLGNDSSGSIQYSTRVPNPLKKKLTWSFLVSLPILVTVAALQYATYIRTDIKSEVTGNIRHPYVQPQREIRAYVPHADWTMQREKGEVDSRRQALNGYIGRSQSASVKRSSISAAEGNGTA